MQRIIASSDTVAFEPILSAPLPANTVFSDRRPMSGLNSPRPPGSWNVTGARIQVRPTAASIAIVSMTFSLIVGPTIIDMFTCTGAVWQAGVTRPQPSIFSNVNYSGTFPVHWTDTIEGQLTTVLDSTSSNFPNEGTCQVNLIGEPVP